MKKVLILISIIILVISISGCTNTKNATNGTFGEKTVDIKNITIINNVTAIHLQWENGTSFYYIEGYLKNNNKIDVYNIKMKAIAYDNESKIVGVNESVLLEPKVLPAEGQTEFIFTFNDPDRRIVRYELQLISGQSKV